MSLAAARKLASSKVQTQDDSANAAAAGVLFVLEEADKPYSHRLSELTQGTRVKAFYGELLTLAQLEQLCKRHAFTKVVTTRESLVKKLLPADRQKKAKINNYAGSVFKLREGIEMLVLAPLKQLISVPYGKFLAERYISKVAKPETWRKTSEFSFSVAESASDMQLAYEQLADCDIIGVDIETVQQNLAIRCIGYCGYRFSDNKSICWVLPLTSMHAVDVMRNINWLHIPKVLQNGNYDCAYLFRYGAPLWGYYYDTINATFSTYCELPKDLAAVSALWIRESMYWKDLAETNDLHEYYRYNALDCWATVESFISWISQAPQWALDNYKINFANVPIAHMCDVTGVKRDQELTKELAAQQEAEQEKWLESICTMVGYPNFNPSSPKQVLLLLQALKVQGVQDSREKTLEEAIFKHPLNARILEPIIAYRKARKETSTYLVNKELPGSDRTYYAILPHGTDTGRKASKASHFWCGLQIQNAPRDGRVKETFIADPGFVMYEADYGQADARGVAFESGDENLLATVLSENDFHSWNASQFFGIPYQEIFDNETGKTVNKPIRQLSKNVNHGTNYNMQALMLALTMGTQKVLAAKALLHLPREWSVVRVCEYLLQRYEVAYPTVKTTYYESIKREIRLTNKLVGATGWTRYCFSDPTKSKHALNSYIAHVTQSLTAMILDLAWIKVFNKYGLHSDFKLYAQIHDSLWFAVRIGSEHIAEDVAKLMEFPVPVTDCKGVTRDMILPVDLKKLGSRWRAQED